MRWGAPLGTERTRARFLIFPKECNGEVRWLERATWVEERMSGVFLHWIATKWID